MRVCILGSGLTALTLAKALVNQNIFVDILYHHKNYSLNQTRTLGISKSNLEYFNKNILNIDRIIWKLRKIEIYSENLENEKLLNFKNSQEHLFSIIKNFQLYEILEKSLLKNKFFKKIKLKKKLIDFEAYDIIINTDYSSFFTKKFFSRKIVKSYNSLACTTIIKHEKISNNVATQVFTKRGPLAFLPISESETSIVYSINNLKKNMQESINSLINNYNFKYKIKKIEKLETFELKSFVLRSYYKNNILAFGDLLHRIHPLAGQGFNMTIRDLKILITIIREKIDLGLPLDKSVCYEFEKKIKHKNYIFLTGIDFINEFFNFENKFKSNVLSKSIKLFGNLPSVNKMFIKIADEGIMF